jgi:hypothetical protein
MKWTKLSALLMELFRLRVQYTTMRLLWQRSLLLRLPKDLDGIRLYLEQPSADTSYTFVLTNARGSATTTDVIVTVPAGATTGTSYQQLRIQLMKWTKHF